MALSPSFQINVARDLHLNGVPKPPKVKTRSQTNFRFPPVQLHVKIIARFDTGAQHQNSGMTGWLVTPMNHCFTEVPGAQLHHNLMISKRPVWVGNKLLFLVANLHFYSSMFS